MTSTPAADDRAAAQADLLAGRFTAAASAYRRLIDADPNAPNLRYDLGAALAACGDVAGAADAWSTARVFHGLALLRELGIDMERFANDPAFAAETGRSLAANGLPGVAGAALARALEAQGPEPLILADYAVSLLHQGAVEEACEVLSMADDGAMPALMPLMMAAYSFVDDGGMRRSLLARQAASMTEEGVTPFRHGPVPPGRPLKVAYIAGASPLEARFLAVIARHDPNVVEAVLLVETHDSAPEGFTAFSIGDLSDADAARAIAVFGFDMLVDLSGPSGGRLGVFASRPAPVQISWSSDLATTGLTAMDAKLLPSGCIEPDAAMLFSETLIPMGPVLAPWQRVSIAPRQAGARFTFGAFMAPALMTDEVMAALATAMSARPESRLVIKHAVMDDPVIQRTLAARFLAFGVSRERLDFRGMAGVDLDQFDFEDVDLALDSRPTMGEAQVLAILSRGTPILCACGPTTRGRLVAAPLKALGLEDLIADDLEQLATRAIALSQDPADLAAIRDRIEAAFETSAYGDCARVTRDLEMAYSNVISRIARRSAVA